MAIFRNVNMSFWTDPKVVDDYTPEDRYFMLYALTNNYTNIIGCYEISIKQMSNDLGYTKDVVENLLKRFKEIHKTIDYDFDTKELMVINWNKYNWSSSPKLDNPLFNAIESVKSDVFHDTLATIYNNRETIKESNDDTLLIPYRYGIDTTITITNTIPITSSNSINANNNIPYEEIKDLFNEICVSYPKIIKLNDSRKTTIKARYKEYKNNIEIFKELFTKAENSKFLKGNNDKGWSANFDWLLNPRNMIKVLEGNYNKNGGTNNESTKGHNQPDLSKYDR